MKTPTEQVPDVVLHGKGGNVTRVAPAQRRKVFPTVSEPVDVWVMHGGMHMAVIHGENGYAFLLAYLDNQLRDVCDDLSLDRSLCVDVWSCIALPGVTDDDMARNVLRYVAKAAVDGVLPIEPIRPGERVLWTITVLSIAAVLTQTPITAV